MRTPVHRQLNALAALAATATALGMATLLPLAPVGTARANTPEAAASSTHSGASNTPSATSSTPSAASSDKPLTGSAVPVIEQYLRTQTAGLRGEVRIRLLQPHSGPLPACEGPRAGAGPALEPFLPTGTRAWGRISVGLRCHGGLPWTRYVTANVAVHAPYYVAARAVSAGQLLSAADAERREGDLALLPAGVVLDPAQIEGMLAQNPVAGGAPWRRELLRGPTLIQQGQMVRLVQRGNGFQASAEGKALSSAATGATLQVRMPGGQVLSGVVRADGTVLRGG